MPMPIGTRADNTMEKNARFEGIAIPPTYVMPVITRPIGKLSGPCRTIAAAQWFRSVACRDLWRIIRAPEPGKRRSSTISRIPILAGAGRETLTWSSISATIRTPNFTCNFGCARKPGWHWAAHGSTVGNPQIKFWRVGDWRGLSSTNQNIFYIPDSHPQQFMDLAHPGIRWDRACLPLRPQ